MQMKVSPKSALAKLLFAQASKAVFVGRHPGEPYQTLGDWLVQEPEGLTPIDFRLGMEVKKGDGDALSLGDRLSVTFIVPYGPGHTTLTVWLDPNALAGFLAARKAMQDWPEDEAAK